MKRCMLTGVCCLFLALPVRVSAEDKLRRLIVAFVHTILDELHGTALFLDLEALSPAHLKAVIVRRDRFDRGMRKVLLMRMSTEL